MADFTNKKINTKKSFKGKEFSILDLRFKVFDLAGSKPKG